MPIYEYQCLDEHITEKLFHLHERPKYIKCEKCNNEKFARLIISSLHSEFKNVPKLIDKKRNKELALKREQLAEQNERGY